MTYTIFRTPTMIATLFFCLMGLSIEPSSFSQESSNSAWAKRAYLFPTQPEAQSLGTLSVSTSQQQAAQETPAPLFRSAIDDDQEVLEDVQQDATRESYALKAAKKETEAATGEVYRSFSRLLPRIDGMVSREWARDQSSFTKDQKYRHFQEDKANILLSLPLITGGRTLFGIKKAQAAKKAAQANFMATRFQLELEATHAYLSLIKDRRIESSLKQAKKALSRTQHATNMRYQAGDASRTDIALATSARAAMEAEYYNAKMQRQHSETALKSLIQRRPKARLMSPQEISAFALSLEDARQLVLTRNPTLIKAFHQADIAKHNIGVERASALPQLSLSGRYAVEKKDQEDESHKDSFEKDYRFGFNLQVPLLNAESLIAVKVSRSRAAAQYYNALDTRRTILKNFDADWRSFGLYHHKKQAITTQLAALKQALVGMEYEYKAGIRPITDVLTYQVNKVRAEVTLAQTHFEGHILHNRILLATGKAALQSKAHPMQGKTSAHDFIVP